MEKNAHTDQLKQDLETERELLKEAIASGVLFEDAKVIQHRISLLEKALVEAQLFESMYHIQYNTFILP